VNILFAAAEMSPLAKVGGLGDVAGSLPRALRARGDDVRVALPLYAAVDRSALHLERVAQAVTVPWPDSDERVDVHRAEVRGVPVYLVENERYFGRPNIYAYDDDAERFLFFCDALVAAAPLLGFAPDAIHAQDWHTALLLTRLATRPDHAWSGCGRVYTIHNLGLQGPFDRGFAAHFGVDPRALVAPDGLTHDVALSGMAQGILHADFVNTVSDTYAREILTPEYGAGLDTLLRARAAAVSGIVNGIDYEEFDPQTDSALAANYSVDTLDLRVANKRALQERAGLPGRDGILLFGVVTRLFAQKGIDLVAAAFDAMLGLRDAQLVVLGTGDEDVHGMLQRLEAKYPDRVKVWLEFNPALGQLIYGGCDCFLMPSRYEPCGLGQLISLRYGAVPLVRRTGGLTDTVQDVDAPLRSGTGFVFDAPDARKLEHAAERALAAFEDRAGWRALQERGMRQDWSWRRAAAKYGALYQASISAARTRAGAQAGA
jgi:starch synthase